MANKQCPVCKMEVDSAAVNCPGCNALFDDSPAGATADVSQEEDPNGNDNGGEEDNGEEDNGEEEEEDETEPNPPPVATAKKKKKKK